MTLRELYPFWPETHDTIIERLEILSDAEWNAKPCHETAGSVRQIVIRMIRHERGWIQEIAQKRRAEPSGTADLSPQDLIGELKSTRESTSRWLAPIRMEGLREVRTAPANPITNQVERNVTLAAIIWEILEHELISWGQIQLRLAD